MSHDTLPALPVADQIRRAELRAISAGKCHLALPRGHKVMTSFLEILRRLFRIEHFTNRQRVDRSDLLQQTGQVGIAAAVLFGAVSSSRR